MKKLFLCVTFLVCTITSFSACGAEPAVRELSLDYVLEIANARREGIAAPSYEVLADLAERHVRQDIDLTRFFAPLPALPEVENRPEGAVTLEEAIYDVNLFFEIMILSL